jgi:hypothetical protein
VIEGGNLVYLGDFGPLNFSHKHLWKYLAMRFGTIIPTDDEPLRPAGGVSVASSAITFSASPSEENSEMADPS